MHKNNLSFDTLNPKTPLSARWAQMSKQEQLIETKRLEILAKMEAQKKAKLKPSEAGKPDLTAMNKFSNDGSFMNQFKKLSDDLKRGKKADRDLKPPEEEKNQQVEGDRDRRPDRHQSSSGSRHHNRERSRSPNRDRKRNVYKWEASDRQDNRDGKHRRWDSGGHSRHRTSSPSTPVVEDSPRRNPPLPFSPHPGQGAQQPFFDTFNMQGNNPVNPPPMFSPNSMIPSNLMFQNANVGPNFMPNMNIPPSQSGSDFNSFKPQMQINQISFPTLPPHANSVSLQNSNQGNQNQFNLNKHNNFPPVFGVPSCPPGVSNIMPPNNFNQQSYCPRNYSPPVDNGVMLNMQMKSNTQGFTPMLFPNIPTPQGAPNKKSVPNTNIVPQPVNAPQLNPIQGLNVAPPISVPLHTIPEPKPLDTLSIPPPKPLDAVSIPPPKPLDAVKIPPPAPLEAVKIPPPKPMNLQTIPPPSPICLTQIPKPKELDVCSIPPPPTSSVLSSDDRRWSALEAVAAQVARTGDDLEDMLKTQCQQDPSIWFLRDENCADYQIYRDLVSRYRKKLFSLHGNDVKKEEKSGKKETAQNKFVPEEEKYEPEFCLDYESSEDETKREIKIEIKQEIIKDVEVQSVVKSEPQISENGEAKVKSASGSDSDGEEETKKQKRERKRKSRWGDGPSSVGLPGVAAVQRLGGIVTVPVIPPPVPASVLAITGEKAQLTKITRQEPGLLQYALNSYGTINLTEEDWKKCEDHYKISLLYQEMLKKRRELECLAASGRHKYEYDSDEEVEEEGGTWEHRLRQQEMEATSRWAGELTRAASGKHHIGDFLPPEELKRFMDKYSAVKGGQEPDLSDYKEYKLKEDNIGFKMLQKLGWSEGEGLGADGSGIVNPVNKGTNRESNQGLGVDRGDNLEEGDDEFDAYRKRMMLAYRFRPNPLNNPRRPYY